MMKRLSAILLMFAALVCTPSFAQDSIEKVLAKVGTNRVVAEYSCTVKQQNVPIKLSGKAVAQGKCFTLKGNGIEVYCDSETLWYVDREAKEVYVEDASGLQQYVMENAGNVDDLKLTNVAYKPLSEDMSAFIFETKKLDSSWVVTDMR